MISALILLFPWLDDERISRTSLPQAANGRFAVVIS
jgi:hypothetical protein